MQSELVSSTHFEKTKELFGTRLIDLLAQALLDAGEYVHWRSSARAIQEAIYKIDTYYESHGALSAPAEQLMWKTVESRIKESNGSSCFSVWKSYSQLQQYA